MKLRITDSFASGNMKIHTRILRFISRILYPSISKTVIRRENLYKSVTEGTYLTVHAGAYGKKEIIPVQWCQKGIYLSFEGIQVHVAEHYHEWLTQLYGDYMKLPPENKRIPHHYVAAFDLEKPYSHYI